jgi:hypothetical protein
MLDRWAANASSEKFTSMQANACVPHCKHERAPPMDAHNAETEPNEQDGEDMRRLGIEFRRGASWVLPAMEYDLVAGHTEAELVSVVGKLGVRVLERTLTGPTWGLLVMIGVIFVLEVVWIGFLVYVSTVFISFHF